VLATDTGISAALGLVRSQRFAPLLADAVLIWLRTSAEYFVSEAFVRERVPAACREIRVAKTSSIDHPERIPHARAIFADVLADGGLAHGFISGDGAVNYALLDDLVAAGVPATRDHVESFFNMPKKSAAVAVSA
jgi:ferredoxin-NADP reductase